MLTTLDLVEPATSPIIPADEGIRHPTVIGIVADLADRVSTSLAIRVAVSVTGPVHSLVLQPSPEITEPEISEPPLA